MPTSLSITPKQREKARERYEALDATSRAVVQMASIIYEPVPRATLLSCLDTIGVKNTEPMATTTTAKSRSRADNARSFTASTFNDILTPLFKNTLLETSMMGVTCGDAVVEIATRDAIKCGQFKEMVEVVRHYMPVKKRVRRYTGPRNQLHDRLARRCRRDDRAQHFRAGCEQGKLQCVHHRRARGQDAQQYRAVDHQ